MIRCFEHKGILLFLLIPFFKPICFQYDSRLLFLDDIFVMWKIIAAVCAVMLLFIDMNNRRRLYRLVLYAAVFEGSILFSTVIKHGYIQRAVIDAVSIVSFIIILFLWARHNSKLLIETLRIVMGILITMDMISKVMFPHGLPLNLYVNNDENSLYFMTLDNGSAFFLMFGFMVFTLDLTLYKRNKSRKIQNYVLFFISTASAFLSHSMTAVMGVCGYLVLYTLLCRENRMRVFATWILGLFYPFVILMIFLVSRSSAVGAVMQVFFNRNTTFTGRTLLWNNAIHLFRRSPVIGMGRLSHDYIAAWGGYFSSHNFWLELLLQGGVLAAVLYFLIVVYTIRKTAPFWNYHAVKSMGSVLFMMMFCGLMESVVHSVYLFGTIAMMCTTKKLLTPMSSGVNKLKSRRKLKINETDKPEVEQNTQKKDKDV